MLIQGILGPQAVARTRPALAGAGILRRMGIDRSVLTRRADVPPAAL